MKRKTMAEQREGGSAKRLRFSELSQLILTEPKSREEVEAAWYNQEEIAHFRSSVRETARTLRDTRTAKAMKYIAHSVATGSEQARFTLSSLEVIRGIEHLISPQALKYMLQKRERHTRSVLEEYQAQERAGKAGDPASFARMRMVSETHSSFANEFFARITLLQNS